MPDQRQHRGPHPEDLARFAPCHWPALQRAVTHLSWLLTHQYALLSALKLVGDHLQLDRRQRLAVQRAACSDQALAGRRARCLPVDHLAGGAVAIDGFNLLLTVEAALSGGVLLQCRDSCLRDMASVHGSYRRVAETRPALERIGGVLTELQVAHCTWWLDRPVSNSGRLATLIRTVAAEHDWHWTVELAMDVDHQLIRDTTVVISADGLVLDQSAQWVNLAPEVIRQLSITRPPIPLQDDAPAAPST